MVTKLFIDFGGAEGEVEKDPTERTAFTPAQVKDGFNLAARLKEAGNEVDMGRPGMLEVVKDVRMWIDGVENIKDKETKVSLGPS